MTIKKGVSITLCTYNGKKLLVETLEHIVSQKLEIPCELILVDNASTDGTRDFADQWWQVNGHPNIQYRSLEQPIPGKSYAQDLAYEKASYEYILVCDDDNWLDQNYIQLSYELMEANLEIGALGGYSEPVFENRRPEWFDHYKNYYAVGKQSNIDGDITEIEGCLYGAGMVIRKSHWLALRRLGFEHLLSCRKGNELSSGGDTEYCYALQLLGYKIWYDERLSFKHFMTSGRLNFNYLSRLRKAMAYSNFVIHTYRCVSKGVRPSKTHDLKKKLNKKFLSNVFYYFFGNFNQKEVTKAYFRGLKLIIGSHAERMKHYDFIKSWVSNKKK
jgi:glycosyltransferase involved in cell wall biosynthesis